MSKTPAEILLEVNVVFCEVLATPDVVLTDSTTANDVEGWDSLNHVRLIAAVEERFGVKFMLKEVMRFANVGDMCRLIYTKLGS